MQTFFLIRQGQSSGRGSSFKDPTIEASDLASLIRQTFAELPMPSDVGGSVKISQHRLNPDLFDLYFYSNMNSGAYRVGGTYTAPELAQFSRTEFEDYRAGAAGLPDRLQEFARRLVNGELKSASYE